MFISLDLETTGLDKRRDKITEFGATKFDLEGNTETFKTFINPGIKIPEFITHITNISDDDVKDAPPLEDVKDQIEEFIGDLPIIGHFISFDTDFLKANKVRLKNPQYDTAEIARIFIPGLPSYSLEILSEILDLKHLEKHRALDDAIAAQELFIKLIDKIQTLPPQLLKEIISLSAKSSWDFAEVIQTLKPTTTTVKKTPATKKTPQTPSSEEEKALELIASRPSGSTNLIELFAPTPAIANSLFEQAKASNEKTIILVPSYIFRELPEENKIGAPENYISLSRLETFKQKEKFNTPEITALIKTMMWLEQTQNGYLREDLMFSPDERQIISHIQTDLETTDLDKEPFVKKAIEIEQKSKAIISDYSYVPKDQTDHLVIIDVMAFIDSMQTEEGETISLKTAAQPLQNLTQMLSPAPTQKLDELISRVEILFGILESYIDTSPTTNPYRQPAEIGPLDIASSNWQKAKDLSQSLISSSQELKEIITPETLPYLKNWKEVLRTLEKIFADPNLENFHIWIQKSYDEDIVIRKIPISVTEHFKKLKSGAKRITILGKSIDAADGGSLIKTLLNIDEDTPIHKIEPAKSGIFVLNDITGPTTEFIKNFIRKEHGRTIIIVNSIAQLEQTQLILAPKLKKENLTLLAQKGSGGLGKILELYKLSPDTSTILLTPNRWEGFDLSSLDTKEDFKNLIILKVPFAPPSDQYIVAKSKNFPDPWNELQIPLAILSLKKIIGKFLAKTSGQVVITDDRLIQKSYGKFFIKALEDFGKTEEASKSTFI